MYKICSFILVLCLFSCLENKINNTKTRDENIIRILKHDSLHNTVKPPFIGNESIPQTESSQDIAESSGYDLGFNQGFEDAGSFNYDDEQYPDYIDKSLQTIFIEAYKRGYEDGWIEWKNRNNDLDY